MVVTDVPGATADDMRRLIDAIRQKAGSAAIMLAASEEGKVTIVAGISPDLEKRGLKAGDWIRGAATMVGGSGGGRPNLAQAGGKDVEKLPAAFEQALTEIRGKLK